MREIKFRVFDKSAGQMYYLLENRFSFGPTENVRAVSWEDVFAERNERLIPLQYTGLKDRNYREVYEGDVVETYDAMSELYTGVVEYESEFANFIIRTKEGWKFSLDNMCEVIGNIYENHSMK